MANSYSLSELISTAYSLVLTKIFFPKARLVRRPVYLRGRKSFHYLEGLTTGHACRFDLRRNGKSQLNIGKDCQFGDYCHIVCYDKITIGSSCLFASKVFISDTSHGSYGENGDSPQLEPVKRELISRKVEIGNNVWLGENVCVLPGVSIGNGCIVGANSVVTRSIKPNTIVAGAPAKVIKSWNGEIWVNERH